MNGSPYWRWVANPRLQITIALLSLDLPMTTFQSRRVLPRLLMLLLPAIAMAEPGAPSKPQPDPAHPHPKKNAAIQGSTQPAAAGKSVDFAGEIKPLLEASCAKCHAKGRDKGGFSMETREAFLRGGDTGTAAVPGKSAESYVVELLSASNDADAMPKKGTRWTDPQIALLRAWIDQGMQWPANVTLARPSPENLRPRKVALPDASETHPIDKLLAGYFKQNGIAPGGVVEDRIFARRVYLDLIGLLPTPDQLETFLADVAADKRERLIRQLLSDRRNYADHWLTFWNDLLRNDYRGAGFIDGGRKQISGWLYTALVKNLAYDKFVAELVDPAPTSEGFTRGIIWRGTTSASMTPPMQAAQNISQVFLGVNLKCASCHDSFVSDWTLADAYGVAAIYSEEPLKLVHCDKPTSQTAAVRFLYPELGGVNADAAKSERLKRLAEIMTSRENGRVPRTIVNRLWARLLGRGLVEPIDDMEKAPWHRDLLDWLSEDFVAHNYDLQHTLAMICTSRAYQLPPVESPDEKEAYVFRGPLTRRLTAEQFADAISAFSGEWNRLPSSIEFDFAASGLVEGLTVPKWVWTDESVELGPQREAGRAAKRQLEAATKKLAEAQSKIDEAENRGGPALEEARVAAEQAAAAATAAQERLKIATGVNPPVLGPGGERVISESERHRVLFRKEVTLPEPPTRAYAAVLASQRFEVQVNGREAKPIQRDGFRNSRIALLDLKPLLVAGENVITIDVSSHTEKQMNDSERQKFPGSAVHLNRQSGLAFYVRCESADRREPLQIITDETWRVRRSPEGSWQTAAFADETWKSAIALPVAVTPVDEGPGLQPITRRDFANLPVDLGPQLSTAVSTAAHAGGIRAALVAADPLQVALDRPNREVVVPVRASAATTLQGLELTNGATLDSRLKVTAVKATAEASRDGEAWVNAVFRHALSRMPTAAERAASMELLGGSPNIEIVADYLWAIVNLPEFQFIN